MTAIDLDALEALAHKATAGPWHLLPGGVPDCHDILGPIGDEHNVVVYAECEPGDAEYIAAVDPPTVLALVARLRRAEECIEKVRSVNADYEYDEDAQSLYANLSDVLDAFDKEKTDVQ